MRLLSILALIFLFSCGGGDSSSTAGGGNSNKTPKKTDSDNPLGNISATAGSYGENIITGGSPTSSPLMGVNPSDADAAYVSADESICTVDGDTGAVTGVDEGECRITLTLSKAGYNDKIITYTVPVVLSVSDFKGKHLFKGLVLGQYTKVIFVNIDGDGDQDLVVGENFGTLKYYRRNAADAPTAFSELTGSDNPFNGIDVGHNSSPTFADVDGDGDQDLVVGEYNGTLKYFLNESTTETISFTEQTSTDNPFNGFDVGLLSAPTFADVDGDGDLDLVVGESGGTLQYFLNGSSGETISFTEQTNTDNPFNGFDAGVNSTPTFADVDGDGDPDLVVGESGGILKYYLNESTGGTISFTAKTAASDNPFDGFDAGSQSAPTFTDIDGDSDLDLVVAEQGGTLKRYLNGSTGSTIAFTDQTSTENLFNGIDVGDYSTPTFADIDKDGDLDFVLGEYNGILKYFLNESSGGTISFTEKTSTDNPFNGFDVGNHSASTFADIDGDGDLDLVVGESTGTLKYFLNGSTGGTISFTEQTSTDNPFNGFDVGSGSTPAFADLDGDGDLELVAGRYNGTLKYYLNESTTSTISFTAKTAASDNPFDGFDAGLRSTPVFADIDGDGDQDLIVGESNGTLKYFLNESTGSTISFAEKTGTDNPFNGLNVGHNSAPTFIDIDGDGDLELVVGEANGGVLTAFNYFGTWVLFH